MNLEGLGSLCFAAHFSSLIDKGALNLVKIYDVHKTLSYCI